MALMLRNKIWHIYYRGPDGRLVSVSTGLTDKRDARAVESAAMLKNRSDKQQQRLARLLAPAAPVPPAGPTSPTSPASLTALPAPRKRLKLCDVLDGVARYRDTATDARCAWTRFVEWLPADIIHADQVTSEHAFNYLQIKYGQQTGKAWNNNKTCLHNIFKVILLDAGMSASPFALVVRRKHSGEHQRPFTAAEAKKIIRSAPEPWKSACVIAWHTGLRQKDVFALRWSDIKHDIMEVKPAKTARFNRAVQIPVHPELAAWLNKLPRVNERVLGFSDMPYENNGRFSSFFGKLLVKLKIKDNERGIVVFNSFRDSFVTRCDEAGMPRHAIRGMAGHTKNEQTDLYSHDQQSARQLTTFPALFTADSKGLKQNSNRPRTVKTSVKTAKSIAKSM